VLPFSFCGKNADTRHLAVDREEIVDNQYSACRKETADTRRQISGYAGSGIGWVCGVVGWRV